ncbi:uncharacterized protein LOC115961348 [Quercus lobata]|uniref:uncharacterized protein LOC115961348 n=1 Tax=Quercus lobata TaxID=97700 RepID=UPI00124867AE|nr:uncharacterized protein LOC115961348 [Quercus lobata]
MNPLKCTFGVTVGKFLGFLIHQKEIDMVPLKVKAIVTMKPLISVKELKSFIGKLPYIQRFISGLVAAITPFTPLLKKGVKFQWSNELQLAFRKLQEMMTNLPTVRSPTLSVPLKLYLASNDKAVGALIAQEGEDAQKLRHYLLAHIMHLMTKSNLIRTLLQRSSISTGGGAGIVLANGENEALSMSFKLDFLCSNNVAEYEAYLTGLVIAR